MIFKKYALENLNLLFFMISDITFNVRLKSVLSHVVKNKKKYMLLSKIVKSLMNRNGLKKFYTIYS